MESAKNFGYTITHNLSRRLAEAGLDLAYDVYLEVEKGNT